ncbi:anti-phage-associated DUF1156 domain-containing protein [Muricoccus radiodurans]|uniref:anti-phage-associated DUF1156 domain-containing protein n=1 Tax=Muricoccus radiodurans TaxID=2231721 RepID=UPI003CE923AF
MDTVTATTRGPAPFSLKDAPALIERVFPAQKVGIEAQKERKAGAAQTLTALGSYWKGRKPLVLVRACVLASLLPATDDPEGDLELFEALMRMDPEGISRREAKVTAQQVSACRFVAEEAKARHLVREDETGASIPAIWRRFPAEEGFSKAERALARTRFDKEREIIREQTLAAMSFSQQVAISERVERVENLRNTNDPLYAGVLAKANDRLGTDATTLPELVEQLGLARFGRRPVVGDPFAGGGSIPFEATRIGCDVVASDLNPVAAMLTWGSVNVIGADETRRAEIVAEQARVAREVSAEIEGLGVERNEKGDHAKAYLYCLETVDPRTGWRVPMSPSWVVSRSRRCVVKLVPIHLEKRFGLEIVEDASAEEMAKADLGTARDGYLVYSLSAMPGGDEVEHRIAIARLRGDGEGPHLPAGGRGNRLRLWDLSDVAPREPEWNPDASPSLAGSPPGAWVGGDVWLERLYSIQWIDGKDLAAGKSRPKTFFATPTDADLAREAAIRRMVQENLASWQADGLVPDMPIEAGEKTDEPIRTRGWTHWHHLFNPRALLLLRILKSCIKRSPLASSILPSVTEWADWQSRLCRWETTLPRATGGAMDGPHSTFYNQALNTILNYCLTSSVGLDLKLKFSPQPVQGAVEMSLVTAPVTALNKMSDLWIYDPPYADAVHYHEITEFFIAWLRKNPPAPFDQWTWDSRRPLAIQGKGEKFRCDMVDAFRTMAEHMPDNGLQVCMFTHQDAGVWADMAGIVWGAGLRVTAAWYVSTETTSELRRGGYVQGTVLLVLRKRQGDERAYKDELVLEVRGAVQRQVDLLTGLNQRARALQRDENPFSDADLQMAGYAAALEVLTGYTHIEGMDMTREALRPRVKGQKGVVEEMIALAVQTATELMRPEGIDEGMWERLVPTERFWLKMVEAESERPTGKPEGRVDDYQNFAKAYRADGWAELMADQTPNKARLKGAAEFKRSLMSGHPFAGGLVRPVLYAVNELRAAAEKEEDPVTSGERAVAGLRENLGSWAQQRQRAMVIADWLGRKLERQRPAEASAARTLSALIRTERLG